MPAPAITQDMPVLIFGVKDGQVVSQGQWVRGYAPQQEFSNFAEAQKVFPDLSLTRVDSPKTRFVGPEVDNRQGETWARFDTKEHYNWIMAD